MAIATDRPGSRHARRGDPTAQVGSTGDPSPAQGTSRRSLRTGVGVPIREGSEGIELADLSKEHGVPVRGIESSHVARLVDRAVVRVG